jgi:hypothetical protein
MAVPKGWPLEAKRCVSVNGSPEELSHSDVLPTTLAKLAAGDTPGASALSSIRKSATVIWVVTLAQAPETTVQAAAAAKPWMKRSLLIWLS